MMGKRQERALKKELLLLKGEALRIRARLELDHWTRPFSLATQGSAMWRSIPLLKMALNVFAAALPDGRVSKTFKSGSRLLQLFALVKPRWA